MIVDKDKECLVQEKLDMFSASKGKVCVVQIRFGHVQCK